MLNEVIFYSTPHVLTVQTLCPYGHQDVPYLHITNPYHPQQFCVAAGHLWAGVELIQCWGGRQTRGEGELTALLTKINIPFGAFHVLLSHWTCSLPAELQKPLWVFVCSLARPGSSALFSSWPLNFHHTGHVWSDERLSLLLWHWLPRSQWGWWLAAQH